MKHILVRYKTKPEQADTNQRFIEAVFEELHGKQPDGVRYLALRLGDGTFVCSAPGSLDTSLSHAAGLIEIAACHA